VDDVIDILEQETTEDIYALGGGATGVKTIFRLVYDRCPQARRLAVCVTSTTVTGTIIKSQEDILEKLSHWQRLFLCLSALAAMGGPLNRGN